MNIDKKKRLFRDHVKVVREKVITEIGEKRKSAPDNDKFIKENISYFTRYLTEPKMVFRFDYDGLWKFPLAIEINEPGAKDVFRPKLLSVNEWYSKYLRNEINYDFVNESWEQEFKYHKAVYAIAIHEIIEELKTGLQPKGFFFGYNLKRLKDDYAGYYENDMWIGKPMHLQYILLDVLIKAGKIRNNIIQDYKTKGKKTNVRKTWSELIGAKISTSKTHLHVEFKYENGFADLKHFQTLLGLIKC